MSWQEDMGFAAPKHITKQNTNGKPFNFYPVHVKLVLALKPVAKTVAKLMTSFGDSRQDMKRMEREWKEGKDTGVEVVIEPASIGTITYRDQQQERAVAEFIEALIGDEMQGALGDIVISSLREQFPVGDAINPSGAEFMAAMPVTEIAFFVQGVVEANKGLFDPLAGRFSAVGKALNLALGGGPKETVDPTDPDQTEEAPSPETKE